MIPPSADNDRRLTTQSPVGSAVADEAEAVPCSIVTLSIANRASSAVLSYLYSFDVSTTICGDLGRRVLQRVRQITGKLGTHLKSRRKWCWELWQASNTKTLYRRREDSAEARTGPERKINDQRMVGNDFNQTRRKPATFPRGSSVKQERRASLRIRDSTHQEVMTCGPHVQARSVRCTPCADRRRAPEQSIPATVRRKISRCRVVTNQGSIYSRKQHYIPSKFLW